MSYFFVGDTNRNDTRPVRAVASDYTFRVFESGLIIDNAGAAGAVVRTLPPIGRNLGMYFTVSTSVAQGVTITPNAADRIGPKLAGVSYSTGITPTAGRALLLVAVAPNQWAIVGNEGFA